MNYVIVDGTVRECRAKDPSRCRYHVGAQHWARRTDAVLELERETVGINAGGGTLRKSSVKAQPPSDSLTSAKINEAIKDGRKLVELYTGHL